METERKKWTERLNDDVYSRLCYCKTIKSDLPELVNAKWEAMKEDGKAAQGFTKEDALIQILELLDSNGRCFDLTVEKYNELKQG